MNSVTTVRKLSTNRSITENQPQKRTEPLLDQPRVADARDRAEPYDHLLVDDQHGHQQQQHPQQAGPVVLARLRVGGDSAGVVVADHHDQPGADDREQRQQPRAQASMRLLVLADRAERAAGCPRRARSRARRARAAASASPAGMDCSPSARPPFSDARSAGAAAGRRSSQAPELRSERASGPSRRRPRGCYFGVARRLDMRRCRSSCETCVKPRTCGRFEGTSRRRPRASLQLRAAPARHRHSSGISSSSTSSTEITPTGLPSPSRTGIAIRL